MRQSSVTSWLWWSVLNGGRMEYLYRMDLETGIYGKEDSKKLVTRLKRAGVRGLISRAQGMGVDVSEFINHSLFGRGMNRWTHGGTRQTPRVVKGNGWTVSLVGRELVTIENVATGWAVELKRDLCSVTLYSFFKGELHDPPNGEGAIVTLSVEKGRLCVYSYAHYNGGNLWSPDQNTPAYWCQADGKDGAKYLAEFWVNGKKITEKGAKGEKKQLVGEIAIPEPVWINNGENFPGTPLPRAT